MMLPLWWPRSACVYCGARIVVHGNAARWARRQGGVRAKLLACPEHQYLVALDPHLRP